MKTLTHNHTLAAQTSASCLLGAILLAGLLAAPAQPIQPEVLFHFQRGPSGPIGDLVNGKDGWFYGTSFEGGKFGYGSVFKVTTSGTVSILVSFSGSDGIGPRAGLTLGGDGNFYGTTSQGGFSGTGTVFMMDTNGALTTLASFPFGGGYINAGVTFGGEGNLYGTTVNGGDNGQGAVFKITTNGNLTTLASFNGSNGSQPYAGLTLGNDGHLYGTTCFGGTNGMGTVFKITTNGILTTLVSFEGFNGSYPQYARLTLGADGNFYGTTPLGGSAGNSGTLFKLTPSGTLTTLVSFDGANGSNPQAGLVLGDDGNFYGTTSGGGSGGYGSVFRVTTNGALTTLVAFDGVSGVGPMAGLTLGDDGNFYGTTFEPGGGTMFRMTPGGVFSRLTALGNANGAVPNGLTQGSDGNLYSTTEAGGDAGLGTVFKLTTNGNLSTLASFNSLNGANPVAALAPGRDGTFYGTTAGGGSGGYGTVFSVTTNGALTSLVAFDSANGANPQAALTMGSDGDFYGTTEGGNSGGGTVFKVTTNGTLTTLIAFDGANGNEPLAGLTTDSNSNFYGTTSDGGTWGYGTVFKLTTNGTLSTLNAFDSADGANPIAELTQSSDGNFYGTTSEGGDFGAGTVFRITTNGTLTTLVSFNDDNGANPRAALMLGSDGNYYGTTLFGGSDGHGTVFQVTTNGKLAALVSFANTNGAYPDATLTLGSDGNYYGTTSSGGSYGLGTIFRLTPAAPVIIKQPQPESQIVPAGVNVTIDASVFGAVPLICQWIFNNTNLPGKTAPSLTLNNVSLAQSGNYSLRVTNSLGFALSSNAVLTVLPAVVTTLPVSGITATGTVLNASVTIGPDATLAWFEWGTDTSYGQIAGVTNIAGGTGTVDFSNALSGLNGDLIYHYRVVASNSFGIAYGTDESFQVGLAPAAVTLAAAVASASSVTLNASINPRGRSTTAWFRWGVTTNYGNLTPATGVGSGVATSNYSGLIAGLAPSTTYHCRAVASNSAGLAIGSNVTFVTAGPPLAVTGPATFVTGTNAWINGWVTPNLLTTTAWFEWGTNTTYGSTVLLGEVGSGSAAALVSSQLNNLNEDVTYHFRLVASNSAGIAFGANAEINLLLEAHAQSILADQPLIYYRFDEASGTTAWNLGTAGAAGNGTYNATVSLGNPSLVPAFGFAAGFNNSNSMIAVPALGSNNQVTIEVWARPRSFGVTSPGNPPHSSYNSIYTADDYVSGALHTHFVGQSPSQRWQVAINPNHTDIDFGNAGWFPSDAWVHLVATHDSAARRTIAYVNGRAIFTNNSSTTVLVSLAAAHIGNWIGRQNWFDGFLDEFAIYTNALSASRIQTHYQTAIGNPVLLSTQTTNSLTFSWAGPGFRLQSNTNLANAASWINVSAGSNSPVSVTISNSSLRFFRLKWP